MAKKIQKNIINRQTLFLLIHANLERKTKLEFLIRLKHVYHDGSRFIISVAKIPGKVNKLCMH
jgi:hypothetical protein